MQLIKQKNRGQCLITAHSMCMGMSVDRVLVEIGHDGMEKIHPDLEEPFCYRGFHQQEIIDHAYTHDTAVIHIEGLPGALSGGATDELYIVQFKEPHEDRLLRYLESTSEAIILGKNTLTDVWHAVAWDGKQIYDPQGTIYPLENATDHRFGAVIGLLVYRSMSSEDPFEDNDD